ncbi:MAG: DVUA0089 family protein [Minwuia sp.]|uniref:DVUA0089 family protein n=1 Tax=Minwuia sp. TaxID=2493630 RepID=UPI003A84D188
MSRSIDFRSAESGASVESFDQIVDASGQSAVVVNRGAFILTADYARSGPDLVLTGVDGAKVLLTGFFDSETPPDIYTLGGAQVSGHVASLLAGAAADGLAQAGGSLGEAVGAVESIEGTVFATRTDGSRVQLNAGDPVYQDDVIETSGDGNLGLRFADGTTFAIGESARMVIDDFVYDPSANTGNAVVNVLQGSFSFVSGAVAKTGDDALTVSTPVLTIGIRGTYVTGQGGQEGETTEVVNLPDDQGNVGSIFAFNQAGGVLLNDAYEGTETNSQFTAPGAPRIYDPQEVNQKFQNALDFLPPTPEVRRGEAQQDVETQRRDGANDGDGDGGGDAEDGAEDEGGEGAEGEGEEGDGGEAGDADAGDGEPAAETAPAQTTQTTQPQTQQPAQGGNQQVANLVNQAQQQTQQQQQQSQQAQQQQQQTQQQTQQQQQENEQQQQQNTGGNTGGQDGEVSVGSPGTPAVATGTILASGAGSIAYFFFTLSQTTSITMTTDGPTIDPQIFLFNDDGSLDNADFLATDDDDGPAAGAFSNSQINTGDEIGNLPAGNYVLAVSDFSLSQQESVDGANVNDRTGDVSVIFEVGSGTVTVTRVAQLPDGTSPVQVAAGEAPPATPAGEAEDPRGGEAVEAGSPEALLAAATGVAVDLSGVVSDAPRIELVEGSAEPSSSAIIGEAPANPDSSDGAGYSLSSAASGGSAIPVDDSGQLAA